MIFNAFPPNFRICKFCDLQFEITEEMLEGESVGCECGAVGELKKFPCGKPGCDCGGWLGVLWDGIDYERKAEPVLSIPELWFKNFIKA